MGHPIHNSLLSDSHSSTIGCEKMTEGVCRDLLKSTVRKLSSQWFESIRSQAVAKGVVSQLATAGAPKQWTPYASS